MNSNQPRSEDEEDEAFTLITRNGRLNQSDKLMSLETEQVCLSRYVLSILCLERWHKEYQSSTTTGISTGSSSYIGR